MTSDASYGELRLRIAEEWLQHQIDTAYNGRECPRCGCKAELRYLQERLKKVRTALRRHRQKMYETCERCGGRIDRATHEVYPDASICSGCDPLHTHIPQAPARGRSLSYHYT